MFIPIFTGWNTSASKDIPFPRFPLGWRRLGSNFDGFIQPLHIVLTDCAICHKASASVNPWLRWRCNTNIQRSPFASTSYPSFHCYVVNIPVILCDNWFVLKRIHGSSFARFLTKTLHYARIRSLVCQLDLFASNGCNTHFFIRIM